MSPVEGNGRGGLLGRGAAAAAALTGPGQLRLPLPLSFFAARGLRNSLFSGARYMARPALSLVATPILLSYLGVSQYGIWMTVTTVLGVTAVADFGILDSIIRYVSKYDALGDEAAVARIIRAAVTVCTIVGIAGMAIMIATAPYVASHLFRIAPEEQRLAISALEWSGAYFLFGFINAGLRSALRGCHRFDLDAKLEIAFDVVTTLTNLALALSGYGLRAIMASLALWSAVAMCVSALTLKRTAVRSLVFWPLLSRGVLGESAGYAAYVWSQGVTAMLLANFDRLLVASWLGPDVLAYYAVAMQLSAQVHGFLSNVLAFLFPTFSEMNERDARGKLRSLYCGAFVFTLIAGLLIAVPLYGLGPLILKLWLGSHVAAVAQVSLRVLVCYYLVTTMTIIPHYLLNGVGNSRFNAIFLVTASIASIAAALVLLPRFGAPGAALARLAIVPVAVVLWGVLHRRLGLGAKWTIAPASVAGLATAAAVACVW